MSGPVTSSELRASQQGQLLPVAPSCASFAAHETDVFVLGTEQGHLYSASRVSQDDDLAAVPYLEAHRGPVRQVASHAPHASLGSPLVASCGADWRVRVWQAAGSKALALDMPARCSATRVSWMPSQPAGLLACDAAGWLYAWNLEQDAARPVAKTQVSERPLSAMALAGHSLLVGDLDGSISIMRMSDSLLVAESQQVDGLLAAIDAQI